MRRLLIPTTLLLLAAAAAPAYAGAGLPKIASLEVGKYRADLYADSEPAQASGTTFTLAIFDLAQDSPVRLKLVSPRGEMIEVPLKPLTVLEGPADAHASGGHEAAADDHGAAADSHGAATGNHGAATDNHGAATDNHAAATDNHAATTETGHGGDDHATASFNARGRVALKTVGTWTAILEVPDDHGHGHPAEATFEVGAGGPNRVYLGFTGFLMGGTMIYSLYQRRNQKQNGR